jgi:hypothetical protein
MSERIFFKVTSANVFDVVDPDTVRAAACTAIASRSYGDGVSALAERQADLDAVEADLRRAVLEVSDAAAWALDVAGLLELSGTTGVDACSSDGDVLTPREPRPDFAALYPVCDCDHEDCPSCSGFQFTPRNAALLRTAAYAFADEAYDDVDEHGDDPVVEDGTWQVFDQFPRITFGQDAVWRRQAARAGDDLAHDIEAGELPIPRCAAEEMALRLVLRDAAAMVADMAEFVDQLVDGLPPHPDDFDTDLLFECLMHDDDLGQLFDADLTGSKTRTQRRTAASGWATTARTGGFPGSGGADPRDGRRPFRR